jgi:purine-binding chemotaxis protein CheW
MKSNGTNGTSHEVSSWDHIHHVFTNVRENLGRLNAVEEDAFGDVLERRAREYARIPEESSDAQEEQEDVLQFSLGPDTYAIPCSEIEEVLPMQNLVPLPQTPRSILGISSNRGLLFVVLDIKRVLNIPASELTTMHRVIVIRHELHRVGLLVDVVHGMRGLHSSGVRELPAELNQTTRRFLRGITPEGVLLLNAYAVVNAMSETSEPIVTVGNRTLTEQHEQVQT